ncbi:hypothetical protein M0802_004040 [Mischocyttarus mexicanus]|nr:hypothetical protein M0802_015475 [Mischocyttarus mexicanus]KAI4500829.1 hypothetical protein M0802_004040 [Mischocyttarus mexicanus]
MQTSAAFPPWQTVTSHRREHASGSKKRARTEDDNNNVSQRNGLPETVNRFSVLTSSVVTDCDMLQNEQVQKTPLPPPIYIDDVLDIQSLTKCLNDAVRKDNYTYKISNNQVRVLPADADSYRKITKTLKSLNASFHTYQLKQERSFRVVLRNVHHSADLNDLKNELMELGHEVVNISNIYHRATHNPLSMFFIDLKQKPNNNMVYNINKLNNTIVKFEPPRKKKEIAQCKRCQKYGHTQKYCNRSFQCVKCSGQHATADCKKSIDTPPTCFLCGANHTANYKGCPSYQEMYKKTFPTPRIRKTVNIQSNLETNPPVNIQRYADQSMSYAQAINRNLQISDTSNPQPSNNVSNNNSTSPTDSISRLEKLIEKQSELINKQIEQSNNLISLLTVIVSKLSCTNK